MNQNRSSVLRVVYGAQWGSEGKGQICAAIAARTKQPRRVVGVRVGGPNAGHTATAANGKWVKAQQVPIPGFTTQDSILIIGATGCVHLPTLAREIAFMRDLWGNEGAPMVYIDNNAVVITDEHMAAEAALRKRIASTAEGVGEATAEKVRRQAVLFGEQWQNHLASTDANLAIGATPFDSISWLNSPSLAQFDIILEGTQGYLLGLDTSGYYPYTTSRECGPEALLGQVGLTSRTFERTIITAVMRTYPIRVGGPSGPLPNEIDWQELYNRTGGYVDTPERTTVTKTIRRIAELDMSKMRGVLRRTRPHEVALTFCDYIHPAIAKTTDLSQWGQVEYDWLREMQRQLGVPIRWVSTGPGQEYTFPVEVE